VPAVWWVVCQQCGGWCASSVVGGVPAVLGGVSVVAT